MINTTIGQKGEFVSNIISSMNYVNRGVAIGDVGISHPQYFQTVVKFRRILGNNKNPGNGEVFFRYTT